MKLLKIDNKLVSLHLASANTYNITDNVPNHTIKQIVFYDYRFVILTTTKLYNLVYTYNNFKLIDLTDHLKINIDEIKFVVNSYSVCFHPHYIGIITHNDVLICKTKKCGMFRELKLLSKDVGNVVAVSNKFFGLICKINDGEYNIIKCDINCELNTLYTLNKLPTTFLSPCLFLYDNKLQIYCDTSNLLSTTHDNISYMYNNYYYYTNDGLIHGTSNHDINYGRHVTKKRMVVDININHRIVLNLRTNTVEYKRESSSTNIGQSYYYTESLGQYNNVGCNVMWSPRNHHMFDKYTGKFVKILLLCDKYGNLRKWIPKGILYLIIGLTL